MTPFYPSPGADHGYDVASYVDVDPQLGTLADFDALLADAHGLGLKVLVDIVPNHTSSEHPWFRNALSSPDHPHRARYVFRPGLDGGPPNGWTSVFGGPAWTLDEASGEWYLHLFAPEQPDLDWHVDAVPEAFEEILRFWFDRGVDGFRIDVAQALFKAQDLHEVVEPENPTPFADWHTALQHPELHGLYRHWRELAGGYDGDRAFVAEISLEDEGELARFVRPDELNLVFNFAFLHAPWEADALRGVVDRVRAAFDAVGAPPAWVLENHDVTRLPTRRGDGAEGLRRARASLLLMLALPGAAFVYQGQELGLEEAVLRDDERQDPIFARTNGERLGRDGCRVPLPWTDDGRGRGFTTGVPWLPIPEEWAGLSVERQQGDAGSTLELTRKALALRREQLVAEGGTASRGGRAHQGRSSSSARPTREPSSARSTSPVSPIGSTRQSCCSSARRSRASGSRPTRLPGSSKDASAPEGARRDAPPAVSPSAPPAGARTRRDTRRSSPRAKALFGGCSDRRAVELVQTLDRRRHLGDGVHDEAGCAVDDDLGHGAAPGRDHGCPAGGRLGQHEAEWLFPVDREEQGLGASEQRGLVGMAELADVLDPVAEVWANVSVEIGELQRLAALGGDPELASGGHGDLDRLGSTLLERHPAEEGEVSVVLGAKREAVRPRSRSDRSRATAAPGRSSAAPG